MDREQSEMDHVREIAAMKMDLFADQVRKLGELHEEGLLTDEEFTSAKAELLSRL